MADAAERKIRNHRGFTLIEILVVVAIIGILMAIAIPAISAARRAANKSATAAQMKFIADACEMYYNDFNDYPGMFSDESYINNATISGSQSMFVSLARLWNTTGTTAPNDAREIDHLTADGTHEIWVSTNAAIQPKNYSAFGKIGKDNNYAAYYTPKAGETMEPVGQPWLPTSSHLIAGVPTLVDAAYKSAGMPILYYRMAYKYDPQVLSAANPGTAFAQSITLADATGSNTRASYYVAPNYGLAGTAVTTAELQKWVMNGTQVQNGFVLISAGGDRAYGTSDDIVVSGAK